MAEDGEWNRKGAALSDVTAQKEWLIALSQVPLNVVSSPG